MKLGSWTPADDQLALYHLQQGKTFGEVGKLVGKPRCGVISRAHRKGWTYPARKINTKKQGRPIPVRQNTPPDKIPEVKIIYDTARFQPGPIDDMRLDQCRFISGDARGRICCGKPVASGISWCVEHARQVFTTVHRSSRWH